MLRRLADLLRYPDARLMRAPDDSPEIREFFDEIERVDPEGMEELYTQTFDLNPVATLEIGWHLWGEQYERGRFLADLRALQASLGIDEGTELPDHLTVLLETLDRMDDPAPLAERIAPALAKIAAPLEEHGNPYRHLIAAAVALLPACGEKVARSEAKGRMRGGGAGDEVAPSPGATRPPLPASGERGHHPYRGTSA